MKKLSILSFCVMFLIGTDTFLVAPLLPTLSKTLGFPLEQGGWLVSAYAIGYCCAAPVAGPISDHFNRRTVLIVGMIAFSAATLACGFATSFISLLILRVVTGVCAASGSPQIWAVIPQLAPSEKISSVMAAPTAGLTISTLLGVPLGSFLSTTNTSAPFLVVGGLSLLVSLALLLAFPSVPRVQQAAQSTGEQNANSGIRSIFRPYALIFATTKARLYFLAYLIFQTGNFAIMTFISTWFSTSLGLTQAQIGVAVMVIGVGNTLGAVGGSAILRRVRHGRLLGIGFLIYLIGYAILPFSTSIVMACSVLFATYFVSGMTFPIFIERLQSLTTTQRGTISAFTNVTMYAGSTIAGIVGGPLLVALPGFWGIAILAFVMMAVSLLLWRGSGALVD